MTMRTWNGRQWLLIVSITLVLALSSCGGRSAVESHRAAAPTAREVATTVTQAPSAAVPLTADAVNAHGLIATPKGPPEVHTKPTTGSEVVAVPATTSLGAPTTFAVLGLPPEDQAWLQVLLPARPNGSSGWVRRADVAITSTSLRIEVDRSARRLRVLDDGDEQQSFPIAVGTDQNPTPAGLAYVIEVIESRSPSGAYGPFAIGLALHSDTLTEFNGGAGQVGIHGTNRPDLIGQAVSHGCIRVANDDIAALVDMGIPLGTPVIVR